MTNESYGLIVLRGLFCLFLLPLQTDFAWSADGRICQAYAQEAVAKAQGVSDSACGYDGKSARWGRDFDSHFRWCRAASLAAVERETQRRRGQIRICQLCRGYANAASTAATNNANLKCGFAGPRWTVNSADHFAWCMARAADDNVVKLIDDGAYAAAAGMMERALAPEISERVLDIEDCRARRASPRKAQTSQ